MSYLITQLWICLLIAAAIGAIIGYWLAKSSCRSKLDDLDASWRHKLEDNSNEHSRKLAELSTSAVTPAAVAAVSAPPVAAITEQSSYEVEDIEGIGKSYGKKLRDMGISTTEQLLNTCFNLDGRITVAEQIGIEDFVVRKWASMADLMRINDIEGQYSELMVYAGVDSVQELGQENASALHSKLSTANAEQNRVKVIPDETTLAQMINHAKSLREVIQDT